MAPRIRKKLIADKDRSPEVRKRSAKIGLDALVRAGRRDRDYRTGESSISSIVRDMPEKFAKHFEQPEPGKKSRYFRADGTLNEAGKSRLAFYDDGRSEFQRDLNRFRESSPFRDQAYANRFPLANFAMKAAPTLVGMATGVPIGLMDMAGKAKERVGEGLKSFNFVKDLGSNLKGLLPTTWGGKNLTPEEEAALRPEDPRQFTSGPLINPNLNLEGEPDFLMEDLTVDTDIDPIFKLPYPMQGAALADDSTLLNRGNYLVSDGPDLNLLNASVLPRTFNEGGLASLLMGPDGDRLSETNSYYGAF